MKSETKPLIYNDVYFVYRGSLSSGSAKLRALQISFKLNEMGIRSKTLNFDKIKKDTNTVRGIKRSIIVFLKITNIRIFKVFYGNGNILIIDSCFSEIRRHIYKIAEFVDGIISPSYNCTEEYKKKYDKIIKTIYHHIDEDIISNCSVFFNPVYIGDIKKCPFKKELDNYIDFLPFSKSKKESFIKASEYNVHIIMRKEDGKTCYNCYSSNAKLSFAAGSGACVLASRNSSYVELLGEDYPYFCDSNPTDVIEMLKVMEKDFLNKSPRWKSAMKKISMIEKKLKLDNIVLDYIQMFNDISVYEDDIKKSRFRLRFLKEKLTNVMCSEFGKNLNKYNILFFQRHGSHFHDFANLCHNVGIGLFTPYKYRKSRMRKEINGMYKIYKDNNKLEKDIRRGFFDFIIFSGEDDLLFFINNFKNSSDFLYSLGGSGSIFTKLKNKYSNQISGVISPSAKAIELIGNPNSFLKRKLPLSQSHGKFVSPNERFGAYSYIHYYDGYKKYQEYLQFQRILKEKNSDIVCEAFGRPRKNVKDFRTMRKSRITIHIKDKGMVCNAVSKSMAVGTPVFMDRETYEKGYYDSIDGLYVFDSLEDMADEVVRVHEDLDYFKDMLHEMKKISCNFFYSDFYGDSFVSFLNCIKNRNRLIKQKLHRK